MYVDDLEDTRKGLASAPLENTLKKLKNIGLSGQRYSGYARSIYQVMTGERIVIDPLPVEFELDRAHNLTEGEESLMSIHPNPSSGVFYLDAGSKFKGEKAYVDVYNSMGGHIETLRVLNVDRQVVNISSLPNGVYFIRVRNELEDSEVAKFIKQ